jgi:fatty-acid desaturase
MIEICVNKNKFSAYVLYIISGLGITAGAHRLWAHRSYKAKVPLRIILAFFNTVAFQDAAIDWARDHRVHHKYSETDADPHNATRYDEMIKNLLDDKFDETFFFAGAFSSRISDGFCAESTLMSRKRAKVLISPT